MRVGVLTFHRSTNFGTMLQAHATIQLLESLGVEAELIDYRPSYIERTYKRKREISSPKDVLSVIYNSMIYKNAFTQKADRFIEYHSNLSVSKKACTTIQELERICSEYDIILSGSDQLWNKNITGDDFAYFFPFSHPYKVSLASSFGTKTIDKEREKDILPYLKDFKHITVREKTAKTILLNILKNSSESDIRVILDPTMIITRNEWSKFELAVDKIPSDGYILTYYMIETPILRKITETLEEKTGLKVVNVKPSKRQMIKREGINLPDIGPGEFLKCYSGAKYVVTNSFHGTAFALNFEKPVYVSPLPVSMAGEVNSRLLDLLETFRLQSRWIDTEEKLSKIDPSEGLDISHILQNKRDMSKESVVEMIFGGLNNHA